MSWTPDRVREILDAKVTLAKMNMHEHTARFAETDPDGMTRDYCRRRYRELLGFDPEDRHAARSRLEHLANQINGSRSSSFSPSGSNGTEVG